MQFSCNIIMDDTVLFALGVVTGVTICVALLIARRGRKRHHKKHHKHRQIHAAPGTVGKPFNCMWCSRDMANCICA